MGYFGMETGVFIIVLVATIIALYMAWNIGANDVANAMGTSVGSGALTLRKALIVAAVLEVSGALLVGSSVTNTVRKGIIDPDNKVYIDDPNILMYGMLAAMMSAALWLTLATYYSLPVSTTHSIVGALLGFGLVTAGPSGVNLLVVGKIMASWVLSPLAGAVLAFVTFSVIRRTILNRNNPLKHAQRIAPWLVGIVFSILFLSILWKGLPILVKNVPVLGDVKVAIAISLTVGALAGLMSYPIIKRYSKGKENGISSVEKIFIGLQIITACYVAFAHGANDVANAIGPFAAVVHIAREGTIAMSVHVPIWMLALGGFGIVAGLAMWGYRVMDTIGKKITEITPTRGFAAEFGAATTVLACSKLGMPVSTTHTLVGAVIGIGLVGGLRAVDLKVVRNIVVSWLVTLPLAAGTAILIYFGIQLVV
jgi:PiT family inorganic phosphate transporter